MQNTSSTFSRQTIFDFPKAELHCHLDGSLRLNTMLDLAHKQGKTALLPATSEEALFDVLKEIDNSPTLEAYLSWFGYTIPLMQDMDSLRRVAYELAEDNARENVRYLEVRYAPVAHRDEGLTLEHINDAVLDGLKQAEKDFGIRTGLIICGLRDRYESASLRQAELAVAYKHKGVIACDLAGGEAGNPADDHRYAFDFAAKHLLNITIHAGEAWGPESIRQALRKCHAHRIGHGTTLIQDKELLEYFVDHQIPLEICPTSNVQTHVVKSYEAHPLMQYVEAGIPVTINTDNRLFSRTTVTDELWRVHELCGASETQIKQMILNGFVHAFLPYDEKQSIVAEVKTALGMD